MQQINNQWNQFDIELLKHFFLTSNLKFESPFEKKTVKIHKQKLLNAWKTILRFPQAFRTIYLIPGMTLTFPLDLVFEEKKVE